MTYRYEYRPHLERLVRKLRTRSPVLFFAIRKKTFEVIEHPRHYKNLRAPLQHLRRVHVGGSFVLTFSVDETSKTVTFEDVDHHDRIYTT